MSIEGGAAKAPGLSRRRSSRQVPQTHGRGGREWRGDRHNQAWGRPVSKLAPYREKPKAPFGRHRDIIRIIGDIIEPIDVEWEAESNPDRVLNP